MRTKLIREPVFGTFVRIVYDASVEEFCRYVEEKYNYEVDNNGEASLGKLVILEDFGHVFLWAKENAMIEVVHETAHLAFNWMRYKGIPMDEGADETFAHLQCFYINEIGKVFERKRKKK